MSVTPQQATVIPAGTWKVDPGASELTFRGRGMFGLATVKGTFKKFEGDLAVTEDGQAGGQLVVTAASLDTKNDSRDKHLRSPDFFDADAHPTFSFDLTHITTGADGAATASGVLRLTGNALTLDAPLTVESHGTTKVVLSTAVAVDRAAAGLTWNKMGMLQGKAHLGARITLVR